jgi:hypothetical protein
MQKARIFYGTRTYCIINNTLKRDYLYWGEGKRCRRDIVCSVIQSSCTTGEGKVRCHTWVSGQLAGGGGGGILNKYRHELLVSCLELLMNYFLNLFQVRSRSSVRSRAAIVGSPTRAIARSTCTCTPRTSPTTARPVVATRPTPTPPHSGSISRSTARRGWPSQAT